jgi:hypothetical protein
MRATGHNGHWTQESEASLVYRDPPGILALRKDWAKTRSLGRGYTDGCQSETEPASVRVVPPEGARRPAQHVTVVCARH